MANETTITIQKTFKSHAESLHKVTGTSARRAAVKRKLNSWKEITFDKVIVDIASSGVKIDSENEPKMIAFLIFPIEGREWKQ